MWPVGKQPADLTNVRRARELGLLITWTTGIRKADTNGPIGITRCGNTWARTSKNIRVANVASFFQNFSRYTLQRYDREFNGVLNALRHD